MQIKDRFLSALSHRDYRIMWTGHIVGESSSWALGAAEGWLIFNLAENNPSSWVGAVFFAAMIPWFFAPIVVGFLTDKFSRRNILILAYLLSLFHGIALTALIFTGVIEVWHILVLAVVNGIARATHMGAIEALAANLVPTNHLPNAYTLISAGYYATRLIGPGLIAPLMGLTDIKWIFLSCVIAYAAGVYLVTQVKAVSTGRIDPEKGLIYNTFSGFRYIYSHPVLRSVMYLVMFHCTLVMSFESLLPAVSNNQLASGGSGVAYLHMMIGLGALIASIALAPIRGHGTLGQLFLVSAVVSSFGNFILGVSAGLQYAMVGTVVIGISHAAFMTIATIMIQSVSPDYLRGRITSIYLIHAGGLMSFSYFANGVLADLYEPSRILIIGGIAFLTVVIISWFIHTPRLIYKRGATIQDS
ncbi:MAG: MFS transporter [Chloroflexota bacterium]|uniref:Major facilitator superfamily (MFS) profile domain-containing protein n=1 Tax=marine metagenome TaxID=408172 RepID=A0A381T161_9ZZZZ|nr:MFS transporter [Chloroflexota bacterium]|tara:strand:+ start:642 stop:1889 length:1248 start_codon:yes stop_codon:yes gene_type:complete